MKLKKPKLLSINPTFIYRKLGRWPISGGLAAFYLLTWLIFGVVYRSAANSSNGRDFIFQDDIKVMSQIAAFKEQYNVQVPDRVIESLITNGRLNLFLMSYPCSEKSRCWVSNQRIGPEWANYYDLLFTSRGVTHFALTFEGREKHPLAFAAGGYPETENLPQDCQKVKLSLYKNPLKPSRIPDNITEIDDRMIQPIDPDADKNLILAGEYTIWLDEKPYEYELNKQGGPIPIPMIDFVLRNSVNLIDDSVSALHAITSGKYAYPLTDFLYFSAVTITTTGYGDILPRTTKIRTLVMIESLLGIITVGAFISSLFMANTRPEVPINEEFSAEGTADTHHEGGVLSGALS